ncbi:DNA primase [Candidatus Nomurabacteria bacterium RIFCSPHIGHO2_02_FULL_33_12]|uniref:DNA primase n=1 Tax=Candidatus Nomurabacteria bacterium RIFCSPLOWO2_01_FULL_33_17 TaxID=1801764 RepID=A0A1F6WNB7_9BACT|nr:MAG: DNA primase [Candidatus Nomurabacteria bacterium RIFCSPHIGHO2_02_FULL_33_12]OGI83324.1 MAG: DNA primase [Candidatus Nomurabacteria bacterium RIFCSPLOWO2_01_FULL_33_17]
MNGSHVEEIKSRLPIDEIIGGYLTLEQAGKYLRAKCPFHNEKSASFYVSQDRGTYYCFGCGEKGDIFSFIERYEGLDFKGALQMLATRAGVVLKPISIESQTRIDQLYACLSSATEFFVNNLNKNLKAKKYLEERGLNEDTIKKFKIGYSNDDWSQLSDYLLQNNFKEEIITACGLAIKSEKNISEGKQNIYDRFRGRIMFPVEDSSGRTIGYSARVLPELDDGKSGKYINSPETELYHKSSVFYGFSKAKSYIRKYDFSILVEGQFDVVLSHQFGFQNTVAVSGTAFSGDLENQAGTPTHLGLLSRLSKNIILALDNDDAGEKAQIRIIHEAFPLGISIKLLKSLENNKDPADVLSGNDGVSIWKDILKQSLHPIEALSKNIINKNKERSSQIEQVKKIILPIISIMPSSLDMHESARIVEKYFSLPADLVMQDLKNYIVKNNINKNLVENNEYNKEDNIKEKFWGLYFASRIPETVANNYRDLFNEFFENKIIKDEKQFEGEKDILSMKMDIELNKSSNPDIFVNDIILQYEENIFRDILKKVKEEILLDPDNIELITKSRDIQKTLEELKQKRRNI